MLDGAKVLLTKKERDVATDQGLDNAGGNGKKVKQGNVREKLTIGRGREEAEEK